MPEQFKCAYTKLVPIHTVQPNPQNPNNHPERQIEMLSKIIDFQGQRSPVVVSKRSGFIVKGHGRLEAIQKLGWQNVAVDYQDYDNEAQEYADMVADNKIAELADHDDDKMVELIKSTDIDDLELFGLDDFELPKDDHERREEIEDEVPEVTESISKLGDMYELGGHRLVCGDSTNADAVAILMNGEKADMVFTDPPYGISVVEKSSSLKDHNYKPVQNDDSIDVAVNAFENIKDHPNVIYWGGNYYAHKMPKSGSWLVWRKKENESDQHDIEVAWIKQNTKLRCFSHVWSGFWRDSEKGDQRVHPTQKPIALAEWCFENYGKPSSVLDLFGGSGSTLIACEKTNRKCFMMELDPHYVDVIVSRWVKYTGKTEIKRNGEPMEWTIGQA